MYVMRYIYIYIWYPPPKKNYVHLTFAGICNILCLFLAAFWTFVFGVPYIYIFCAGRLHNLFVKILNSGMLNNFGRNAFRMHSMHSECIQCIQNAFLFKTKIQDPRFPQDSWLKSWIEEHPYSDKDVLANPKSKIFHKTSVQILDLGSWFWEGMHSLAFSGSDKIALSTF